ncbi:endonuclease/exonuclease/phosphatase family protein [Sulfuriroseicoccus oceanibius]|uniref:Endonuclease/exonuclease/phosphatase family protein n=1 Tax=Sulfuriroseicoccus oceanibius TaxID=2707525 RepID=A0A6B3L8N1_9BACT|nr:endonuclease/exonuclease/phosphatase family protein [Sulfuriroseicoccus oceanibius]QQL44219.1 endonuclease/exonuclease/phosphatase family protein [Sulfuriroseicoccus oceanibius]
MAANLRQRIPVVLTLGAFLLHGVTLLLFHFRWDKLALATVIPVWVYVLTALAMLAIAALINRNRWTAIVAVIWLASVPFLVDESRGVLRAVTGSERPAAERTVTTESPAPLRLVSLNCQARNTAAARQVAQWNPDIVFLQEAPFFNDLKKMGDEWFGGDAVFLRSRECAIIARGKRLRSVPVSPGRTPASPRGIVAQLELLDGRVIELVNVHLDHATTKLSLWSRETWRQHATNRRNRRHSLYFILQHRHLIPSVDGVDHTDHNPLPSIVAGDFNAPAGDAATSPLRTTHTDAWQTAGVGWGNTYPAHLPVHRIDQVWTNAKITPLTMASVQVPGTDHRMVICDFNTAP